MTRTTDKKTTHTNKPSTDQRRGHDQRRAPGYEWVDSRIQAALMGTIGRPFV